MLSLSEVDRSLIENGKRKGRSHNDPVKSNTSCSKLQESLQNTVNSGMNHQAACGNSKSKKSRRKSSCSRTVTDKNQQHQRHQEQKQYSVYSADSREQNNRIKSSHAEKCNVDLSYFTKAASGLRRQIEKSNLPFNDHKMEATISQEEEEEEEERRTSEMEDQRFEKYAERNVCNNSNGGVADTTCWEEMRKAIGNEDANIAVPSAAFIEQDVISKQRQEIMLLMEELGTRDQELNDLVRSHQSQVKAWEVDRSKLKELQQRLCTYEKELRRSDQQLKNTLEEMRRVTNQKEIDGMELKRTKGEMESLSKKIQENSFYLKEMEVQNKTLLESVKKLLSAKEDLEMKGKDLSSRLKSKTGEFNMQQAEIAKLTSQNKSWESHIHEANETNRNLKTETAAWKNRYCLSRDESDRLTEENKKKEEQIQTLTVQLHETLQQTLALQKALFTSCEREKCKEEVMNSLRKQQKRTMQEMSSLRKLYERQSNDLTLYHLSVINDPAVDGAVPGGSGMGSGIGGGGIEPERELSSPTASHDQFAEWQEKLDKVEKQLKKGQGEGKQIFVTSRSNKNMSYNTRKKPNFLNFEARNDSQTFLLKKKLISPSDVPSMTSPDDKNCNERYEFDVSENNKDEEEESTIGSVKNTPKQNIYETKRLIDFETKSLERRGRYRNKESDCDQKKKRSLSTSEAENRLNKSHHSKQQQKHSYSRPQSPTTMKERATSPINSFLINDDSWTSGDVTKFLKMVDKCSNTYEHICRNGQLELPTGVGVRKDDKTTVIDHTMMVSPTKGHGHNETSGVYLSSSDCSCSTLSSPGREKVYDELTPADSDGMCQELKREFLPAQQDSLCSFHKKLNKKKPTMSIHLRNAPQPIPLQNKKQQQSIRKGNQTTSVENDKGYSANHELYACQTYCLVEEPKDRNDVYLDNKKQRCVNFDQCTWSDESRLDGSSYTNETNKQQDERNSNISFIRKENDLMMKTLLRNKKINPFMNGTMDKNENQVVHKVDSLCSSFGVSSPVFHCQPSSCNLQYQNHDSKQPSTSQQRRDEELVKTMNRERTFTREAGAGNVSRCNNNSIQEERKPACHSKNVRIAYPERDISRNDKSEEISSNNAWKKSSNNHSSQSDTLTSLGSDKSDLSLSDSVPSSNTQIVSNPKTASSYLQRYVAETSNCLNDKNKTTETQKNTLDKSHDEKREYFYEENLTSDTENNAVRKTTTTETTGNNSKTESNAYIVPITTSSRPFTSTRAPTLYKNLSKIHYSEQSRRYEWPAPETSGGNQSNNECHLTSTISSQNKCDKTNCNNNMNANSSNIKYVIEIQTETDAEHLVNSSHCVIDNLIVDQNVDHLVTSNMDKFHHHYYNIVNKLNFTNNSSGEESLRKSHLLSAKESLLPETIISKNKLYSFESTRNKRFESRNLELDETCLSQSQIEVSLVENGSVNDVVKKLDFSTSVEQSEIEFATNNDSFSNAFQEPIMFKQCNFLPQSINPCDDMNSPAQKDHDHNFFSTDEGVGSQSSCEENKRLCTPYNLKSDMMRLPNREMNSDNHEQKVCNEALRKDKVGSPLYNGNDACAERLKSVTSLPDYFPDMSCVTLDLEEGLCENDLKQIVDETVESYEPVLLNVDLSNTPESTTLFSKPYSRTSTPTPKPEQEITNKLSSSNEEISTENNLSIVSLHQLDEKELHKHVVKDNIEKKHDTIFHDIEAEITDDIRIMGDILNDFNKPKEAIQTIHSSCHVDWGIIQEGVNAKGDFNEVDKNEICLKDKKMYTEIHKLFKTKDLIEPAQSQKLEEGGKNKGDEDCFLSFKFDVKMEKEEQQNPLDRFEEKLSSYLLDSSEDETSEILSKANVSLSPASKLHQLLVESQKMVCSLEKISTLK